MRRATPPELQRPRRTSDQSRRETDTREGSEKDRGLRLPAVLATGCWERRADEEEGVEVVVSAEMSCRLGGGDVAACCQQHENDQEEELFETSSCASSGDEEDQFPDSGAEEGGGGHDRRRSAPLPQPLRRMNSDSIYDMSGMTAQLPTKKGLSMYYQGKSQSFACMSEVRCLEDLQKKEKPRGQKIKSCKSYVALGGMAKKPASSCANLSLMAGNGFRAPRIPVNNDSYHQ